MKYQWKQRIRYSEVDGESRLTLPNLVNYFQNCSAFQSEDLGVGCEYLKERQKVWVLSFWQVIVERFPTFGEEIVVETFATKFDGLYGTRNFVMTDVEGKQVAYAYSLWVFMDLKKNRPARPEPADVNVYGIEEPLPMEYAGRKIPLPQQMTQGNPFPVQRHHIDTNHHVNNSQYVQMAMDVWEEMGHPSAVRELRIEYKKSAVYGDLIYPSIIEEQENTTISLADEKGNPYAIVQVRGEN